MRRHHCFDLVHQGVNLPAAVLAGVPLQRQQAAPQFHMLLTFWGREWSESLRLSRTRLLRHAQAYKRSCALRKRSFRPKSSSVFRPVLSQFPCRLTAIAGMAKSLQEVGTADPLHDHGYHFQAKQKARTDTTALCDSCGSGPMAQTQFDIQESFPLTVTAVSVGFHLFGNVCLNSQVFPVFLYLRCPHMLCDTYSSLISMQIPK